MCTYYFTPEHKSRYLLIFYLMIIGILVLGAIINIWVMHTHDNDDIKFPYGHVIFTILSSIVLMIGKTYAYFEKDDIKESFFIAFATIFIFSSLIFYTADLCLWIPLGISIGAIIYAILVVPMISIFLPSGNKDETTD